MRGNHFEEQFEDSEANFSEMPRDSHEENILGKPIQLLTVNRSGKIQLNEEALSLIASCETEVAFVSINGKMRTGKSCLLNRLLGLAGRGFKVDPSVSSCTQGIWIWSEPIFNQASNCLVFFLDTEGADSLQKDQDNDAKIFTLSLLISSYLVYNSVGCIDQRSISELQMVTALAHQIKTDDKLTDRQNQDQLYRYMPKFIWLLRDVTLKIQDEKGRKISPTQYLENCLSDQHSSETSRKIKRQLIKYFKDRDCITMVRPVGDQHELQRLDSIPDHALRKEFIDVVSKLRDRLIAGATPKSFGGELVTGPAMVDMIQIFTQAFNSGKVPAIKSAWAQVAEDEGAKAYNLAITRYEQVFLQQFPNDNPKSDDELRIALLRLREAATKQFDKNCSNKLQHQQFRQKLRNLLQQKQSYIIEVNRNVCQTRNHQLLIQLSQEMKVKMEKQAYKGNKKELQRDFENIINQYNKKAKGPSKAEILAQFVTTMNSAIFAVQADNVSKKKQEDSIDKIRMDQIQKMNRMKEKEIEKLKKDLAAKQAQILKEAKDRQRKPEPKENQGCCSGDKCLIM